jgi:pimeloyl-ACP methyl ester carboxylesterase
LSIGILLVMLLLRALHLIPWQRLRDAVTAVRLRLAGWLGDSYIVAARRIEFAAILSKVRRDLDWLKSRCAVVAVVAHSQGAAIASQVLAGHGVGARLLVTFGSGLRKLEQQRVLQADPRLARGGFWTVAGLLAIAASAVALPTAMSSDGPLNEKAILLMYPVAGLAFVVAGIYDFLHLADPPGIAELRQKIADNGVKWQDIAASADPVPSVADAFQRRNITNLGSVVRDHNSYWQNKDVFVPLVGNELFDAAGLATSPMILSPQELELFLLYRRRRVALLRLISWFTAAAAVTAIIERASAWQDLARWAVNVAWTKAGRLLGQHGSVSRPSTDRLWSWSKAAGVLLLILIFSTIVRAAWSSWNSRQMAINPQRSRGSGGVLMGTTLYLALFSLPSIVTSAIAPLWWGFTTLVVATAFVVFASRDRKKPVTTEQTESRSAFFVLKTVGQMAVTILAMFIVPFKMVDEVRSLISKWVPRTPALPSVTTAVAVVLGGFVCLMVLVALIRWLYQRVRPRAPA